jgi:hypothetical protein
MGTLKIKANDAADLAVVSACLQDTAIRECDMMWEPSARRFGFVGQRYMWEAEAPQRINCRLWIEGATIAQHRKINGAETALDLLAITLADSALILNFAGGAAARVGLSPEWCVYLEDFGPAWPCPVCPQHTEGHNENPQNT